MVNVGDTVRVKPDSFYDKGVEEYYGSVPLMAGMTGYVDSLHPEDEEIVFVKLHNHPDPIYVPEGWPFTHDELEVVDV